MREVSSKSERVLTVKSRTMSGKEMNGVRIGK